MDYICTYTRKQALEDELLVDVTDLAKEAGFKFPVAITQGLHAALKNIPQKYGYQDYTGRLWDALYMAVMAIKGSKNRGSELSYRIICHQEKNDDKGHREIVEKLNLKLKIHPGDEMEPVVTIDVLP